MVSRECVINTITMLSNSRKHVWWVDCLYAAYSSGQTEFILTVKMRIKTRHPVGGPFSHFGICNHCRVMMAWIWLSCGICLPPSYEVSSMQSIHSASRRIWKLTNVYVLNIFWWLLSYMYITVFYSHVLCTVLLWMLWNVLERFITPTIKTKIKILVLKELVWLKSLVTDGTARVNLTWRRALVCKHSRVDWFYV